VTLTVGMPLIATVTDCAGGDAVYPISAAATEYVPGGTPLSVNSPADVLGTLPDPVLPSIPVYVTIAPATGWAGLSESTTVPLMPLLAVSVKPAVIVESAATITDGLLCGGNPGADAVTVYVPMATSVNENVPVASVVVLTVAAPDVYETDALAIGTGGVSVSITVPVIAPAFGVSWKDRGVVDPAATETAESICVAYPVALTMIVYESACMPVIAYDPSDMVATDPLSMLPLYVTCAPGIE
jgi:hypothetical protein